MITGKHSPTLSLNTVRRTQLVHQEDVLRFSVMICSNSRDEEREYLWNAATGKSFMRSLEVEFWGETYVKKNLEFLDLNSIMRDIFR